MFWAKWNFCVRIVYLQRRPRVRWSFRQMTQASGDALIENTPNTKSKVRKIAKRVRFIKRKHFGVHSYEEKGDDCLHLRVMKAAASLQHSLRALTCCTVWLNQKQVAEIFSLMDFFLRAFVDEIFKISPSADECQSQLERLWRERIGLSVEYHCGHLLSGKLLALTHLWRQMLSASIRIREWRK